LTQQTWPVELGVGYASAAGKVAVRAGLPGVLTQAAGILWEKWDETNVAARVKLAATTLTLGYGAELVVKTVGGPRIVPCTTRS